jgi:hypothetical protein
MPLTSVNSYCAGNLQPWKSDMNIELDEVVVQDVSDEALEMAAGYAQGGAATGGFLTSCWGC